MDDSSANTYSKLKALMKEKQLSKLEREKRSKLEAARQGYSSAARVMGDFSGGELESHWKDFADKKSDEANEIAKKKRKIREEED